MNKKKILILGGAVLAAVLVAVLALIPVFRLRHAQKLENQGHYEEALAAYEKWDGKDAARRMELCRRSQAQALADGGDYDGAYAILTDLSDPEAALDLRELQAQALADDGDFEAAQALLASLERDEEANILALRCRHARELAQAEEYRAAIALFEELGEAEDCPEQLLAAHNDWGEKLAGEENWAEARIQFRAAGDYGDAAEKAREADYRFGLLAAEEGRAWDAVSALWPLTEKEDARETAQKAAAADLSRAVTVSGGKVHLARVQEDGTVLVTGSDSDGQNKTESWQEIVSVAVGDAHTLGLKADGTCVAVGCDNQGQCQVDTWKNVKQIAAGAYVSVGLTRSGKVLVTPCKLQNMQEAAQWTDITDIAAGYDFILGLKKDGTVLVCGPADYQQVSFPEDTTTERVFAGDFLAVLLQKDGSLILGGSAAPGEMGQAMAEWKKVTYVATCMGTAVGKTADGRLLTAGRDENGQSKLKAASPCQAATNGHYILATLPDGTAVVSGGEHTLDWTGLRIW